MLGERSPFVCCSGRLSEGQGSDFFDVPGSEGPSRTASASDSGSSKAAPIWADPQQDQVFSLLPTTTLTT